MVKHHPPPPFAPAKKATNPPSAPQVPPTAQLKPAQAPVRGAMPPPPIAGRAGIIHAPVMQMKTGPGLARAVMAPPPIAGRPAPTSAPSLQMKPSPAAARSAVLAAPMPPAPQTRWQAAMPPRAIQKMEQDKEAARLKKWGDNHDDEGFVGGSYKGTKDISSRNRRESDHTPPKSTYANSPYDHISENDMPAISMPWIVHRQGQSGMGGGVSTTGSQSYIVQYRGEISAFMQNGEFYKAFAMAALDQQNALATLLLDLKQAKIDVNLLAKLVQTLIPAQYAALDYASSFGLVDTEQYWKVVGEISRQDWLDQMLKA